MSTHKREKKQQKSLVLFVETTADDDSGNTTSGPLAVVCREEMGSGWYWEDLRIPGVLGDKHGFASYQEALGDLLAALYLSSGELAE